MSGIDLIASLLADLDTLTRVSEAGVLSRREVRLEPGETRPAAILFLDLVGFTELARVLPTHQLSTLVDRAFRIFELTVQSHGGYWDARFGDASLYVFPGHPSYPPACEGALLASMALLDRARLIDASLSGSGKLAAISQVTSARPGELSSPQGQTAEQEGAVELREAETRFGVRLGVAFGEVTRQQVGGRQFTVMGDTVNLAQRLESTAEPGTCQTTLRVLDQAGQSISADYRGDFTLKGFGIVQVQRLTAVRPKQLRLRGSLRKLTPLIGRDKDLAAAEREIERWLDGGTTNQLLLIEGPTAVGKSRFAWELLQRIKAKRSIADATAHCSELASQIGFTAELLQVAGLTDENYTARWDELCNAVTDIRGAEYADACRRQLGMLSLVFSTSSADASALLQMEPQSLLGSMQSLSRTALQLADCVAETSIVLIVEDLQWLGGLSEMLAFLLTEVRLSRPLILIATSRQHGLPASLGEVEHAVCCLAPLTAAQGTQLFSALLPGLELPAGLARELHEKAIGLPYYYEEFARMLVRRGIVAPTDGGSYILVQQITELDLPEDVQMLVLGRLDQLDGRLRELTGRASVLGRSFNRSVLARIDARLGLDPKQLEQNLAELVEQHLFAVEPGGRYFFQHMLTQQAAYSALMQHNRRALHHVAALVLDEQLIAGSAAESDILPELATHLLKAGLTDAAHSRACQLLALKAHSGRFENWEQWETFARATWMSLRSDDNTLPEDSGALLTASAARCVTRGQWDEARAHYDAALAHAHASGDGRLEATLLCALGSLQRGGGEFAEAESSYLRALLLAREMQQPQLEAAALRDLGTLQRERGLHNEALDYLLRALEVSRACADKRGEAVTLDKLGMSYMDRFMADAAGDAYSQALALARELRSPWTEGLVLANLGLLHMKYMRFGEARACLDRASELAREIGDPRLEGEVAGKRANLLLRLGEVDAARPELDCAVTLLEGVGNPFQLGFVHCQWALLHIGRPDIEEARASLTRARVIARTLKLGEDSALSREIARCESALEQTAPVTAPRL